MCYKNLLNVNLALQMYLADNDDVFPPDGAWCDAIVEPYVRNLAVMVCPEAPHVASGYALNSALAGLRAPLVEEVGDLKYVIVLFESDRGWNAAGGREALPTVPRHGNGDNYGFLDGSCGWQNRRTVGRDERGVGIYVADTANEYLRWDSWPEIRPQSNGVAGR